MKFLATVMAKWKLLTTPVAGLKPVARLMHKIALLIFVWIVKIENAAALEKLRYPVVFALNHNSYFETLFVPSLLMALTGRKISFFVHWVFAHLPFTGWAVRQIDPVYVLTKRTHLPCLRSRRPSKKESAIDQAVARIRQGMSMGIFPEGGRNKDPHRLNRGRLGLGELVTRSNTTVVPVGIDFPARIRHRRIPVFGRVIVRIGTPITAIFLRHGLPEFDESTRHATADFKPRVHAGYREITRLVMRRIARLCGKTYRY